MSWGQSTGARGEPSSLIREGENVLLYKHKENHREQTEKPYATSRGAWRLLLVPFMAVSMLIQMQGQKGAKATDVLRIHRAVI